MSVGRNPGKIFAAHFIFYNQKIKDFVKQLSHSEIFSAHFLPFLQKIQSLSDQFNNAQNTSELKELFRLCKSIQQVIEKATHPHLLQQQKVEKYLDDVRQAGNEVGLNWGDHAIELLNAVLPQLSPANAIAQKQQTENASIEKQQPTRSTINFSGTFFGVKSQPKDLANKNSVPELPVVSYE